MFDAVATADQPLSTLSPELDVVILSGYHEFRPVERRLIERLADELPMIALLPLHQGGRSGVDAVATDALDVYESLDFETVAVEPADDAGKTFGTITEALYRPDPDMSRYLMRSDGGNSPHPSGKSASSLANSEPNWPTVAIPDDLAVVIPGTKAYSGYVEDTFETFDIPHVTTPPRS